MVFKPFYLSKAIRYLLETIKLNLIKYNSIVMQNDDNNL